ncbi:MAG: hypothetical protein G01um101466_642 [Parcubacteria group bacterium Gr01-1014_66]|nr:MAG: hypothetical protein G01um101466_642 [Parcubacteria group bacterium Gr01-1014_66]
MKVNRHDYARICGFTHFLLKRTYSMVVSAFNEVYIISIAVDLLLPGMRETNLSDISIQEL